MSKTTTALALAVAFLGSVPAQARPGVMAWVRVRGPALGEGGTGSDKTLRHGACTQEPGKVCQPEEIREYRRGGLAPGLQAPEAVTLLV